MNETERKELTSGFDVQTADLSGRWLVEASAGTGKTFALERIVLRLVIEEAVSIDRILVVTFTNAATAELRERVRALFFKASAVLKNGDEQSEFETFFERSRLREHDPAALIESALEHFDEASILTIHGFCQKMLSEFIFTRAGAYDVEFVSDTGFEAEVTQAFLRRELPALTPEQRAKVLEWGSLPQLLSKLGEHGSSVKPQARIDSDDLSDPALKELFERFLQEGPRRVRELERLHGVKSFSALLTEMYSLVQSGDSALERIRNRYDAVLIDEFQDTDRIQYRIFKALFLADVPEAPKSVFFVGDPKQAIYAFRGAELDVYLQARNDIEQMGGQSETAGLRTLETNYRSAPALVTAVNAFFSANGSSGSFLSADIRYSDLKTGASAMPLVRIRYGKPEFVPVMSLWVDDETLSGYKIEAVRQAEAKYMADDIASLLDGTVYIYRHGQWRVLRPGDIAILVKKRSASQHVQRELLARGVRTLLDDQTNVFTTSEADDVRAVFEAMLSPTDTKKFATARATRLIGRTLSDIREDLPAAGADRQLLQNALERFEASGPAAALSYIARERRLQERLLPIQGGVAMLMNHEQLGELLQEIYRQVGSPGAVLRAMTRLAHPSRPNENHCVRKPNDENVVRVVTVHASKGLEYPVVYLVQTESMRSQRRDAETFWMSGGADSDEVSVNPNEREDTSGKVFEGRQLELLRQAYVAMTRASSRLVLPLFIAANSRQYSRDSANNAYVQAMTGEVSPVAQTMKEYVDVLGIVRNAAEETRRRYLASIKQSGQLPDVRAVCEALCRDLQQNLVPSEPCSGEDLFEIRSSVPPAAPVMSVQALRVQAADPVSVHSAWHRSSFTAIASGLGASVGEEFEAEEFEGADAVLEADEENQRAFAASAGEQDATVEIEEGQDEHLLQAQLLLRGAAAGDWIHKLLERVMNAKPENREAVLENIRPLLAASALLRRADPQQREAVLEAGAELIAGYVRNTVSCELFNAKTIGSNEATPPFVLDRLTFGERQCEMPFLLSVPNSKLRSKDVAECMASHGFPMQSLRDNVLQGYLTGAIDMVFVADGKYYILDWKSNWLGASPEDYSQEALRGEIERKHYALQYVIYLTALKRHLMATAGLTQETVWNAIGGAFYVFVRGVNAQCALDEKGRRTGVYFDCPREAVDALDALLGDSND